MVEIEIDGRKLSVPKGSMIIQAADAAGIYIPRFCYHKKLSIAANCRMCLVEVEKSNKPLPACATPVMPNMKVFTQSKVAREAQKAVMEFLLINHPLDCPICDQGGECELQDLAMGYGEGVSRYTEGKRAVFDEDLGPLVATDMTRCIHCTRCVRFCTEVAGLPELGALNRGEDLRIATYVKHVLQSELSGNVIDLCPVGALTDKPFRFRARSWDLRQHATVSAHDCVGSNLYVHTKGEQYTDYREVVRVAPRDNETINENWISDRDRFSYQAIFSDDRVARPMIKRNGKWQSVDWLTALNFTVDHLSVVSTEHSGKQIGALISPSATTEEAYLFQKLMRGIGCHNVDHRIHQIDFRHQQHAPLSPQLGCALADLESQQAILLVGSNVRQEQPLVGHRIRKAALQGAKVMCVNAVDYDFNFDVHQKIIIDARQYVYHLAGIAKALCSKGAKTPGDLATLIAKVEVAEEHIAQHMAIAKALKESEQAVVVLGAQALNYPDFSEIYGLASAVAQMAGATLGCLTEGANSAGAWLAGAVPHREAAGKATTAVGFDAQRMFEKQLKAYCLFGVEPELDCAHARCAVDALNAADFVVYFSPFKSDFMQEHANVILPIATFAETSGTFVNLQGDWQGFTCATRPWEEVRPGWKVLRVLGNLFNLADFEISNFDYVSSEQVRDELQTQINVIDATKDAAKRAWPLPKSISLAFKKSGRSNKSDIYRISNWPMYRIDASVRRAKALQDSVDVYYDRLAMHPALAQQLAVSEGEQVTVVQDKETLSVTVVVDTRVAEGCVLLHSAMQSTAGFGEAFGTVSIERSQDSD